MSLLVFMGAFATLGTVLSISAQRYGLQGKESEWVLISGVAFAAVGSIVFVLAQKYALKAEGSEPELVFDVHVLKDPHPTGSVLAGIAWWEHYIDIRLNIRNGPIQVQNLDLEIIVDRPDDATLAGQVRTGTGQPQSSGVLIRAIGQLSQIPNLTAFRHGGTQVFLVKPLDDKDNSTGVTYPQAPISGASGRWHIHCPILYRKSCLSLVVAGVSTDSPPDYPIPTGSVLTFTPGPRRFPRRIEVQGSFGAGDGDGHISSHRVTFEHVITQLE